ncbi:phosphonate ABC transporter ATP-binding protein [Bartonella sp. HY038]|uniref:phosphonate ABC transporter ATP-binding protein n=1 Tax=Bartonella sp. HY038 TaxID=2759660 RepID=UPI0015FB538C|nr:phosphonate ABC transporter ATP-binding protein [Bartonella sp. HY038]
MKAVEVANISKTYGRTKALKGISLSIDKGEMVALIGASGSGKSTLIRHLAGLETADRGSADINIFGEKTQENGQATKASKMMRGKISVIFQQFNLVNRLSLLTNVLIGLLGRIPSWRGTLGFFKREEKIAAIDALTRVGIDHAAFQRASTLSGGQQQRAAIARSLLQNAEILIADEPISALDPASARRVMDILSKINEEDGITMIVSLHQVEYARRFCPRTIAMRDGAIVYDGPSINLTNAFLSELYGSASEELVLPDAADMPLASHNTPPKVSVRQQYFQPA